MGFKIYLNKNNVNLGQLLTSLGEVGNVIFVNGELCIWLNAKKTKKAIINCLRKNKVEEYFLKEINEENVNFERDFVFAWFREHLNEVAYAKLEQERQEELRVMKKNIDEANALLAERIAEYKKITQKEGA